MMTERSHLLCLSLGILFVAAAALGQTPAAQDHGSLLNDTLLPPSPYQEQIMRDLRQFGIGFGIMYYSPDLSQLAVAHNNSETPQSGMHLGFTAKVRIIDDVHVQANSALNLGGDVSFATFMGTVMYEPFADRRVRPMAGIGWGHEAFIYDAGDVITRGGKGGFLVTGGVEFVASVSWGIELYGGYWMVPAVSAEYNGRQFSVELHRPFAGARLIGYI